VTVSTFYVTTPIYYVNAEPHLGHAYTTIIGDALTRWHRLLGDDVKFVTGTDEHGLKIQQAAEAAGQTPQAFTDEIAPKFAHAWERLNIANDDFIRTTEPRHKAAVAELLQRCFDAGDIELDTYSGKYCVGCELYYTDEELISIDGVDECCPIHRRPVETLEEENYFFRLSRFGDRLLDWYAAHPDAMKPENRANEAIGLIRGGLRDFSISRTSLQWGIPLPWDKSHVTYVWFDALTNYLAAVGFGDDRQDYTDWWPVDYHLIGKDIVRQHCVYWPAMLMSAGVELPKGWGIGGWLLVDGEKMAKSGGNVVNPLDLIDTVGVDGFRYYVLAETPYGNDGDFSYEGLVAKYNSDLANNLGNLASRVATVVDKKCGGIGPAPRPDSPLAAAAAAAYAGAVRGWDDVAPSKALDATWSLVRATNAHLEANEPWKAEPGAEVDAVMGDALEALRIVAVLAFAAVPETAQAVWERIGFTSDIAEQRLPGAADWGGYPGGLTVTKGDPLFPRITA
jgi:methionyl-tRNA synthetase